MANRKAVPPYSARGRVEGEDWQAVADALNARMAALRIGQQALATASGVSVATLRQLQHGAQGRRVQNSTLAAVSRALDWPDDHLVRVLLGEHQAAAPMAPPAGSTDQQILAVLLRIEQRLVDLGERITPCIPVTTAPHPMPAHDNGPDPAG